MENMAAANCPDTEFVAELRVATDRYLAAVDAWATAYRKYYRLAGPARKVSGDLQEPEKVYAATRKRLAALAPRARGLCFKHGLKDPWTGLRCARRSASTRRRTAPSRRSRGWSGSR
jgi:hypothetical protein